MEPEEYGKLFEHEEHYWWFVGRRELALRLLRRFMASSDSGMQILDLGCGTGAVLHKLSQEGHSVLGIDISDLALAFSKKRGLQALIQADAQALPLRTNTIAATISLDIFEHVQNDFCAFQEAWRILKPDGVLVLSVPAFRWLWGPHDIALHHFRRYRRPELRAKLLEAGFEVQLLSYSVFFLFPCVVLVRILDKLRKGPAKVSLPKIPNWLNRFLIFLQGVEAWLIERGFLLPWGSSLIAVARKPKS